MARAAPRARSIACDPLTPRKTLTRLGATVVHSLGPSPERCAAARAPIVQRAMSDDRWLGALALLCERITSDPDAALQKGEDGAESLFKQLQAKAATSKPARRSRAWLSQCAVFLDVLPAYAPASRSRRETRRRRGRELNSPRGRDAAPPRPRAGDAAETSCGAAAAASWIFRGDGSRGAAAS